MSAKERLLDAAYRHFYQHGYYGSGLNAILQEAAVPKGSLYHHFASKKALALAVIKERIAPKMRTLFEPAFTACEDDLPKAVEETATRMKETGFLITRGCHLNNLVQELAAGDSDFSDAFKRVFEMLTAIIRDAVGRCREHGRFSREDPRELAQYIYASLQGCLMVGKTTGEIPAFDQCTGQLLLLLRTLS